MVRISAFELAEQIIADCLDYGTWPTRALDALVERALDDSDEYAAHAATSALFAGVVERLADLFEPALCELYSRLFTRVIARVLPEFDGSDLLVRYNRIRRPRPFAGGRVDRVFVLSRVTLGADVAVTSVLLSAAKQRFPDAEILLVGPVKNAELFSADEQITPVIIEYGRHSQLRERLLAAVHLRTILNEPASIVIDPDSRLTQLGLIPVCDDSRYYFFESRAFGGASDLNLPKLTALWAEEIFAATGLRPFLAPPKQEKVADFCVSWGVGENDAKRLSFEAEQFLLAALLKHGRTVLLDCGIGTIEASRVDDLRNAISSPLLRTHSGSYASFASHIMQSSFYLGYDSAGQHVASASGVPLLSLFAGYASERMFQRWRPVGPQDTVLPVSSSEEADLSVKTASQIISRIA